MAKILGEETRNSSFPPTIFFFFLKILTINLHSGCCVVPAYTNLPVYVPTVK